ncbi:MAG: squalene synthase HpnC [Rhodocyclaceae bacterium]|nr:squalene synthase HpnC [Rhodocyclaceae bacterium]
MDSTKHYENFPVASILFPSVLREPVAAIYVFARTADDFADEGELLSDQRQALLDGYGVELDAIAAGRSTQHPVFVRLAPVIAKYHLPLSLFHNLLDAFRQDITKTHYATFDELMDYCRRSADPVGRLLLHLFHTATPENCILSDRICSALQLINHWQDVAVDFKKARCYLPQEDMKRFGVKYEDIAAGRCNQPWKQLMRFQVERARALMQEGVPLGRILPGRIGLEMRTIIEGGLCILNKIETVDFDIFRHRPLLTTRDWPPILWRAITK